MLADVFRLLLASVAFFAAWSWLRAFFAAAIARSEKPSGSMLLLRGGVFVVALVWWMLAVTDMVGWIFGLAIIGAVVWFLSSRRPESAADAGPSSPPADDTGA